MLQKRENLEEVGHLVFWHYASGHTDRQTYRHKLTYTLIAILCTPTGGRAE